METIPGPEVMANIPPAPTVIDNTNGSVDPQTAQQWGAAFFRDAAWRGWASLHAQGAFLRHLDGPADDASYLSSGKTEDIPACALYPTGLVLEAIEPTSYGTVIGADQFQFVATYTPPQGGSCDVNFREPQGSLLENYSFSKPYIIINKGWVYEDLLLGSIWVTDERRPCSPYVDNCAPTQQPLTPPAPLPDDDLAITQASPAQQLVWNSYSVQYVPRKTVLRGIPNPPAVTNDTDGIVPDVTAKQWAIAVYQQATWAKWSWELDQQHFQSHIGDPSSFNQDLSGYEGGGGVPTLKDCAIYPNSMSLHVLNDTTRHAAGYTGQVTQFYFDLKFSQPCKIDVAFPDGTTQTVTMPKELNDYGTVRDDPLLGTIWYANSESPPPSVSF